MFYFFAFSKNQIETKKTAEKFLKNFNAVPPPTLTSITALKPGGNLIFRVPVHGSKLSNKICFCGKTLNDSRFTHQPMGLAVGYVNIYIILCYSPSVNNKKTILYTPSCGLKWANLVLNVFLLFELYKMAFSDFFSKNVIMTCLISNPHIYV